jgi:type II secretory pathway pseudopilin PulG
MTPTIQRPQTSGFTLVEIALALLVASVALMAVFGLFTDSLSVNKRTIDETRLAIAAEDIFDGIYAFAETNWSKILASSQFQIPISAPDEWENSIKKTPPYEDVVIANAGNKTLIYRARGTEIDHFLMTYNLQVGTITNTSNLGYAKLVVNPALVSATNEAQVFYTEFFNYGFKKY